MHHVGDRTLVINRISQNIMENLPDELLEKILRYISIPELGKMLTVSKRWKWVIEGILPFDICPRDLINVISVNRNFV